MTLGPLVKHHGWLLLLALLPLTLAWPPAPTQRPLCRPEATPPPNRFNSTERLRLLREKMKTDLGADWYMETGLSRVLSSPQPSERYRAWISGFTGSSGQVLITQTSAYLFTDTRYTVQADQELDCNWQFYDSLNLIIWVTTYNDSKVRLAVDTRQIRVSEYERLNNSLVELMPLESNLVDKIWTADRPKPDAQEIYALPLTYTGKTWQVKINQTREAMAVNKADLLAVTSLDETAYLLNLRATVLASVPYFPSMVLLSKNRTFIFLENTSLILGNATLRSYLGLSNDGSCTPDAVDCVSLDPLANVRPVVAAQGWSNQSLVWLDDSACSYSMLSAFVGYKLLRQKTPVQLAKAVKNSAEQEAFAKCSLLDSAALVAFLADMQRKMASGQAMTEVSASELAESYRSKLKDFRGLSFETISASGPNAAVVHYRPTKATDRAVTKSEALLFDSGGQYLGCTTDVTRTVFYGDQPPSEIQDAYTRVLMGVIDLFNLTWPARLDSKNIDPFARHHLWAVTKDYGHGTGHGIGLFLGVHEGPNGIGRDTPLVEGNFQSIEPGYYQREAAGVLGFGIRLETLSGIKVVDSKFLRFLPVTWVPFERKLVRPELLSSDQLRWLNWYHAECRTRLTAALNEIGEFSGAAAWLKASTEPIAVGGIKSAASLKCAGPLIAAAAALAWLVVGPNHH